ncbi:substrate-binding domain-containing protein [Chitinophaga sp. GCM10012297]|uniref:Substrate-binding domain-containing protein n=1 Tax=Chitinophaga chungangae TaxID=2821488 RepID=A0ABS3YIJ1_9BACT|nr:substrate-binding domain-containing protein [Chitinophaga chungangae]MBO9154506.1 substrate-binding domain-containing protein [Chitinophaga chungangae]
MKSSNNAKKEQQLSGIKEIARRANVSIATVDRVIHDRPGLAPSTKEKVLKIIKELNYQPNIHARRLSLAKQFRIATLIPVRSKETSFWEGPLKGIEMASAEISQYGATVEKFFYDQESVASFQQQANLLLKSKPDGLLFAPAFMDESVLFVQKCQKLGIPYVLMDSDLPGENSLAYIGPNQNASGSLAAHLISYLVEKDDSILIVNISKELDDQHHLLKKEEGFRNYFRTHRWDNQILKINISKTDPKSIEKGLAGMFKDHPNIRVVFVTNSRVSNVAAFVEKLDRKVILMGYDFVNENIEYIEKGVIDFLICQKPLEQAYKGVMTLYQHLAISFPVKKVTFMPIDIITRENYSFYNY